MVSASAGTGKTQILTSRVLRLLLAGADPSSILCLTFTKAGAAEMAERLHQRLGLWVRLKDKKLKADLESLSEGPEKMGLARSLFARLLDAPGGLRIQTIHAFAQGLLSAFPVEAGLTPGFRPLEEREQALLVRSTLSELLVRAEAEGDHGLLRDVQRLSLRLGEGGAEKLLARTARAPDAMTSLGARQGIEPMLRRAFGLPSGDIEEAIARSCDDSAFDRAGFGRIAALNRDWGTARGIARAELMEKWLSASPADRSTNLGWLKSALATQKDALFALGPGDPEFPDLAEAALAHCLRLVAMRTTAGLVDDLAAGLRSGQAFAAAYGEAKSAAGVADFDDLIRWTTKLLATPGIGDWVRFKLDQRIDHILVDEAQDTNRSQWEIVAAMADEYFAGGEAEGPRTIFSVGDFKQAIFGFQGTDPNEFDRATKRFEDLALPQRHEGESLRAAGRWADGIPLPPDFLRLSIDVNYRSSPPILNVVDKLLETLGHQTLGLPDPPHPHSASHFDRPGSVALWKPFVEGEKQDLGEEAWLSDRTREYAVSLASQIKDWIDHPFRLEGRGRPVRPADILILVRSRGELAALLVARLHEEGVPVAGVDRLLLSAPLAVQDLLAAMRFAVQPLDDLNLASLLVSPLVGWSQEQLFDVAGDEGRGRLWPHMRRHPRSPPESLEILHAILNMADFTTPYDFLERILSGPIDGRRRLLERLGQQARDPIEELLSSALQFEGEASTSLQAFLDWFARGDVEVVRDPSAPLDAVRVMTVHGSKGLQAPVVVLADACFNPDRARGPGPAMTELPLGSEGPIVPIFRPRKAELVEPLTAIVTDADHRDRQEHWRLLYVALTRAEERLFVGGALGMQDKAPVDCSWFSAVERALAELGAQPRESRLWTRETWFGDPLKPARKKAEPAVRERAQPDWIRRPAPAEERPPRPLVPSAIAEDHLPYPPPSPDQRQAAIRGRLLHALFERLPGVDPDRRPGLAANWLERSGGVQDPEFRDALVIDACRILADPRFADLFGADSLGEAPLAATISGGLVVSGTVDRLLVRPREILVADFKTGRRVPASAEEAPAPHLRQMAAYREALRVIFPGRRVETALLYTEGPTLLALDDALLDAHLPQPA